MDFYADLTQELFLKLHQKSRWQFYVSEGFTDDQIQHQLYHIEVPNMVSLLLRKRYPESYRLARRISALLQQSREFQYYPRPVSSNGAGVIAQAGLCRKHVLKVYGLCSWPSDKLMKDPRLLPDLIKDIEVRMRDTRRAGRGSTSQVIISNSELLRLMIDVFEAIDCPADVRTVRWLVLSKVAVEDSRFVSIEADSNLNPGETEFLPRDFADKRPTPEEVLLQKEMFGQADNIAEDLLRRMWSEVKKKPRRFKRLVRVAYHCYFDDSFPSQNSIARRLGISDSLVSHYRKIFDYLVRSVDLNDSQAEAFKASLGKRLAASALEFGGVDEVVRPHMTVRRATNNGAGKASTPDPVPSVGEPNASAACGGFGMVA